MNDETNPYATPEYIVEDVEVVAEAEPVAPSGKPWGFWATFGFSIVVFVRVSADSTRGNDYNTPPEPA